MKCDKQVTRVSHSLQAFLTHVDILETEYMGCLTKLHKIVTLGDLRMLKLIAGLLLQEAVQARTYTAREMENASILGAFLCLSCIVTPYEKNFNYFRTLLPNYPACNRRDIQLLQDNLRQSLKPPIECVHSILKKIFLNKEHKESGLIWIATILQLNDTKPHLNPAGTLPCCILLSTNIDPLFPEMCMMVSSDSFLLNLTEVLMEFCKPFLDPKSQKLSLIHPTFLSSHRFDFSKLPKLADTLNTIPLDKVDTTFNFITEMFFATFYAIHVG